MKGVPDPTEPGLYWARLVIESIGGLYECDWEIVEISNNSITRMGTDEFLWLTPPSYYKNSPTRSWAFLQWEGPLLPPERKDAE